MNKLVAKKINKLNKFKGIKLNFKDEINMEEPCWSGYEMIGTKMLDGREVPNCVPID